ncbi:MAG: hypothetical protein KAR00_02945 [Candidatus Pacebacteria bacterium]|nr:hypothetical protein [Candidatus Paceibacterota bacterium]
MIKFSNNQTASFSLKVRQLANLPIDPDTIPLREVRGMAMGGEYFTTLPDFSISDTFYCTDSYVSFFFIS